MIGWGAINRKKYGYLSQCNSKILRNVEVDAEAVPYKMPEAEAETVIYLEKSRRDEVPSVFLSPAEFFGFPFFS